MPAVKSLQWIHSRLVQPNTVADLAGANGFTWCSEVFPYTVPTNFWLGITSASLDSKFTDGGPNQRASYFTVPNVFSIPDNAGQRKWDAPLVIPPGTVLQGQIINNDAEQQWMNSHMTALLVPKVAGQSYQDAFAFLFPHPQSWG